MTKLDLPGPAPAAAHARPRTLRLEAMTLVVLSCGGASLSAGPLADPTRPPANLASPTPSSSTAPAIPPRSPADPAAQTANRQAAAAAAAAAAAIPALPPLSDVLLQSVQSPARGPAMAIINGQLVKIGDPVAGRLVVGIDAQGVLLRGSTGNERLWLLGDSAKQAAGSILSSRSAQFSPAQDNPEPSTTGQAQTRAERSNTPGQISLARRTQP